MNFQVGVKAFLKNKEGKYLLLKRSSEKYPEVSGAWDVPGGRINPGTSLLENLRREVKEETGLRIISAPRLLAAQDIMPSAKRHIVRLTYLAETEGEPALDATEHIEYRWLASSEMKAEKNLDRYAREVIEKDLLKE